MRFVDWVWLNGLRLRAHYDRCMSLLAVPREGQSTVEYALVGALVVIAAAGAMALLGDQIGSVFGRITTTLSGAGAAR